MPQRSQAALPHSSLLQWLAHQQPSSREECRGGQRPCPHVMCVHHLYMRAQKGGGYQLNQPGKELWELGETCRLDLEEKGQPSPPNRSLRCQSPATPVAQQNTTPLNNKP